MSVELDNLDESDFPNTQTSFSMEMEESTARTVEVAIQFLTIGEVDTTSEKYQAEVMIRSRWLDDEDIGAYDKTKHWYPKLFIENALHDLKEEVTYETERIDDKTMVTEIRISRGSFWERMELQNFPIDIQELTITLASKCKQTEVKLISDTSRISNITTETLNTFRDQQKWQLYKLVSVSETASYDLGSMKSQSGGEDKLGEFRDIKVNKNIKRPKFVVTAFCSRRPGYYITNAYSFNFLITVLSLTIFVIETRLAQNRISGTFTLILTSVSFKMVTGRALPTISYMTSLDKYQIINIIYLVMCCVWHATISSMNVDMEKKIILDKIALACFACVFLSIQIVFAIGLIVAYQKVRRLKKREQKFLKQTQNEEEYDPYY